MKKISNLIFKNLNIYSYFRNNVITKEQEKNNLDLLYNSNYLINNVEDDGIEGIPD